MKKYIVTAKVGNEKFVKYRVNNLLLFSKFLDKSYPDWRFFNVFTYTKDGSGSQIANYTKNRRPDSRFV
jgi:hypothetical protein